MSYAFTLGFLNAPDRKNALWQGMSFAKNLVESKTAREFIESHLNFFELSPESPPQYSRSFIEPRLYQLFQVNVLFWPRHHLMGIRGGAYPKELENSFASSIRFQDSTDQDYPLNEWNSTVPLFNAKKHIVASIKSRDDLLKWINLDEDDSVDIEYWKRSLVYEEIFKALDLDAFIYEKPGNFETMAFSGIASYDVLERLLQTTRSLINRKRST